MPDSERATEYVTGIVQGITQKGADKWVVEVTPDGSQYPKRLWSKSQDAIAAVTDLIGQSATFECGVSEYEREGKMVKSLWLNAINPGTPPPNTASEATGATQSASQPSSASAPAGNATAPPKDPTRVSIERQVSLKSAVDYAVLDPAVQTVDGVLAVAEEFYAYLTFTSKGWDHVPLGPDEEIPF